MYERLKVNISSWTELNSLPLHGGGGGRDAGGGQMQAFWLSQIESIHDFLSYFYFKHLLFEKRTVKYTGVGMVKPIRYLRSTWRFPSLHAA